MERAVRTGKHWGGRNWSQDAKGGIHDDATATQLGFRGGTVAGNIHMDQFVPVLREVFGDDWLVRGGLSLYFKNATVDGERVSVSAEEPGDEPHVRVWMHREDGLEIMSGTASLGFDPGSELRARDLRAVDPGKLRILRDLRVGERVEAPLSLFASDRQRERIARGLMSDPCPEFARALPPWDAPIASPSSLVELLWGVPTAAWRAKIGGAVGLFGAIEVCLVNGPLVLDREYRVIAEVVALTESPKTEGFWFDSEARDAGDRIVARHRMLLRFMKDSSSLYGDTPRA